MDKPAILLKKLGVLFRSLSMNQNEWHESFLIWISQVLLCSIFLVQVFVLKRTTFSVLWMVMVCFLGVGWVCLDTRYQLRCVGDTM